MQTIVLYGHILSGAIAILTGFTAMLVRKGSPLHRQCGNVFFVTMIGMGLGAAYLGFMQNSSGDIVSGVLVVYLVVTAWLTVKRKPDSIGAIEYGAFIVVSIGVFVSAYSVYMASVSDTGRYNGNTTVIHGIGFFVLALMAAGDLNNILSRGLSGKQRLARHLWRMCFAVFVAAGPIFIARIDVFPEFISTTIGRQLLFAVPFVPILLLCYWLIRIRFARSFNSLRTQTEPVRFL